MVDQRTDAQLVDACLAGDEEAWTQLVARYQRLVYSVALRCGLTPAEADDVFQTVFTILIDKLETCRNRERLGAWLTTITRREAWRVARVRVAQPDADASDLLEMRPAHEPPPDVLFQRMEDQNLVRQGLERLGGRCQELLQRLFYTPEPASYAAIAEELKMPEGSIGPTRARCLERLRGILASMGFR